LALWTAVGVVVVLLLGSGIAWLMWPADPTSQNAGSPEPALGGNTRGPATTGDAALDQAMSEAVATLETLGEDQSARPDQAPDQAAAPIADAVPDTTPMPRIEAANTPSDDPDAPRFDIVRVAPDGSAVMAGRAAPGATVSILDGTQEIGRTLADDRGAWVFIPDEPLPPGERQLSLLSRGGDLTTEAPESSASPPSSSKGVVSGIGSGADEEIARTEAPMADTVGQAASVDRRRTAEVGAPPAPGTPTPRQRPGSQPTGPMLTESGAVAPIPTMRPSRSRLAPGVSPENQIAAPVAAPSVRVAMSPAEPTPPTATDGPATEPSSSPIGVTASAGQAESPSPAASGAQASLASSAPLRAAAVAGRDDPTERRSPTVVVISIPRPDSGAPVLALEAPRTTDGGSRVLQGPAIPAAEGHLHVGTVDYTASGGVTLTGTAHPGTTVQLYLDNQPVARAQADSSGAWEATPGGGAIAARLYTLRADQLGADGHVAQRVEMPFQRANLDLRATADGETMVVVQPGNNLWTVARTVYGEGLAYTTIYAANEDQIRDPDLIYPGQVFTIPKDGGEPARN